MSEVIIVGAGPAGSLAATILARAGVRVRLFDRAMFPRAKLCGDTLNPGAMRVLEAHVPIERIVRRALPLEGMLLTGPGDVAVRGRYPHGLAGRSISRADLDAMLVDHATAFGVELIDKTTVHAPIVDANGSVSGVRTKGANQTTHAHHARMVIAADGRASRLARALRLVRPSRPRRWAIGGYFAGVDGLSTAGEMHIRRRHYLGIAPLPGGLTNACVVVPYRAGVLRDPRHALEAALTSDQRLAGRFARATLLAPPMVLGPMACDVVNVGVPGLLMAGDAAGFIDPMTGDGLRFALLGAVMAASVTLDVLAGHIEAEKAAAYLQAARTKAFATKWRFNRTLRSLVASPSAVAGAAICARLVPTAFEALIRYAGDCSPDCGIAGWQDRKVDRSRDR